MSRRPKEWLADRLFGAMRVVIGAMAADMGVVIQHKSRSRRRTEIMGIFGLDPPLNILWSKLLVDIKRPDLALPGIVPFWLFIVGLMDVAGIASCRAAWLFMWYLACVPFADARVCCRVPKVEGKAGRRWSEC